MRLGQTAHALLAVVRKDFIQLRRDRAGLAVLFLMPTALVLVLSLVQNSVIKPTDGALELLLVNEDSGKFSATIEDGLRRLPRFALHTDIAGSKPTPREAEEAVVRGDFQACLIIPKGFSERAERRLNQMAASAALAGKLPPPSPDAANEEPLQVRLFLDPAIPGAFREGALNGLSHFMLLMELQAMMRNISERLNPAAAGGAAGGPPSVPLLDAARPGGGAGRPRYGGLAVGIEDATFSGRAGSLLPTATQQNVPAWTMFGMFFIVVPLSAQIIREKRGGTLKRALVAPVGYGVLLGGKVFVYIGVCLTQFILMLLVGFAILPLLGAPRLVVGAHPEALAVVALSAAFAATGFGVMVGTIARSHDQASMFGAVAIIIAAALGGVMVPVFVMPPAMREISVYSPLAWGLNAFLDVFLRGGGVLAVLSNAARLLAFFAFTLSVSLVYQLSRRD